MKNLKRILSLALAGTMLVGMMMVGASAASFTDADKIEHKEAVETLAALGILKGNAQPDGTSVFDPEGNLTRAQVATMLANIMSGGKDVATFIGKDKSSFTDVKAGQWYVPYIEYCANFGFVNGYPQKDGTKTFAPNANVTATEAARMILNAMGYKWDGQGNWELATEVEARELGLYTNLNEVVTNMPISRDNVAQMLYNSLDKPMSGDNTYKADANVYGTRYSIAVNAAGESAITGADTAEKKANVAKLQEMTFTAATDATAMASTYGLTASTHYIIAKDDKAVIGTTKVDTAENLGHKFLSMETRTIDRLETVKVNNKGKYVLDGVTAYTVDNDVSDLIGQTVKVICKVNASGAVTKVYGVYGVGDVLVDDATMGDIKTSGGKKTIGGYELDASYVAKNVNSATAADETNPATSVKAIDNDGDGKVDVLIATPYVMGTVTYLNNTTISVPAASVLSAKRENVKTYEGIAQNDVVIATPAANTVDNKVVLVKAETVSGSISSVQNTNDVRIDGTWYKAAGTVTGQGKLNKAHLGNKKTLTLWNGYYIATATYSEAQDTSVDLIFVVQAAAKSGSTLDNNGYEANLLFLNNNKTFRADIKLPNGKNPSDVNGKLCTYTEKDGVYTLKTIVANGDKLTGYKNVTVGSGAYDKDTKEVNGKRIADDTSVLVLYKNKDNTQTDSDTIDVKDLQSIEVLTGKDVKTWTTNFGKAAHTYVMTTEVNGIEYAKTVILVSNVQGLPNAKGQETLGYVVSDVTLENDGKNTYALYTIWNGTENVDVKDEAGANINAGVEKGALIKYDDKGNGVIATATDSNPVIALAPGAITGYSAADALITIAKKDGVDSGVQKLDKDNTQIFFIDSANNTGATAGTIRLADKNGSALVLNVLFAANTDGDGKTCTYLVVDVNNILAGELPAGTAATTVGANGVALNLNDIKGMPAGLYKAAEGATKGTGFESDHFGDIEKVLFFNVTTGDAGSYTLEIKSGATTVYKEAATLAANTAVTFRVDTVATGAGIGDDGSGNKYVTSTTMAAAGPYTYTITGPSSNVVLIGSFTK